MKALITAFILLVTLNTYGQKEIKQPELDIKKNTYALKFSPDTKDERIISAYMKGTTEKDSLRFWADGTITTQKIMVTVLTEDKNAKIKVDIVKNHWDDSKISDYTKDGVFQESFDTAKKFGIVLTCDTPNTPFYLAVWTSGEQSPNMSKLYYAMSDQSQQTGGKISNTEFENGNSSSIGQKGNMLIYVIIGVLVIIVFLLAFMVFKKKKSNTLTILIFLFLGQQIAYAGAEQFSSPGFGGVGIKYPGVMDVINFANKLPDIVKNGRNYLDDEYDLEGEAQVDDAGGPRLPSSCLPENYGQDNDSSDGRDGQDGRDGIDGRGGVDGQDGRDGRNGIDGQDGQDGDDGNNGNDGEFKPFDSDKDKPDTSPPEENPDKPWGGKDKPSQDNTKDKLKYDEKGRPKYDKENKWIYYDNSKYPKYDKKGQPIDYGTINENTNFDYKGRPKNNKKGAPIEYDESKYPKYDKNGNPINYNNDDKKSLKVGYTKNKRFSAKELQTTLTLSSQKIKSLKNFDVIEETANNSQRVYASAGMLVFANSASTSNDIQKEGCDCLKDAYSDLNFRRINLEKLRIIYAHAMKKINAGIAFGDGVSAVHGVSALIWQKQKMIILKESIPTLNKAYDDKYAEMISVLEENLKEIDRCESILGYENWYNHAGFIYFSFMKDKYKRN